MNTTRVEVLEQMRAAAAPKVIGVAEPDNVHGEQLARSLTEAGVKK
jgi:hypothetical protein